MANLLSGHVSSRRLAASIGFLSGPGSVGRSVPMSGTAKSDQEGAQAPGQQLY